ncbi:MAG: tRNA pseudouridine(38-40) synthase TruA [Chlamydiales bacterium]
MESRSHTYKLTLSYDGTNYVGWQIQSNGTSIQGLIEKALMIVIGSPIRIYGAGRTDAGVHAMGQVAHFSLEQDLNCQQTLRSLNGILPYDIRILALVLVPNTFHAQYSAIGKEYHYHLWLEKTLSPFLRLYRYHVRDLSNIGYLHQAAQLFVGTHDFSTFTNHGSGIKRRVRTIHRLDVIEEEGGVRLEFEGNGFLYKMVRNIVGTLIETVRRKKSLKEIEHLLKIKNRQMAGFTAPAHGLFLMRVIYH